MDIIENKIHLGLLIINNFFFLFYCVLFNKGHAMCDENSPSRI
jgi:hypothetical protein